MDFLYTPFLGHAVWLWLAFVAVVVTLLVFDLGVLHKDDHEIGVRESLWLSAGYISVGLLFGAFVWWKEGHVAGTDYFTAFLVEKSLSMDNVFVISLIFTYFAVPRQYQHRVLFWGILGAIVMRAALIGLGAAIVKEFDWVLYLFGAFLVITGAKMLFASDSEPDVQSNRLLMWVRRRINVTPDFDGHHFWVKRPSPTDPSKLVWWATPLFMCLFLIEVSDLIFAVDSVPAVFAVTQDPFVVYTSNIFAILGLRALYFALAAMIHRFEYLKYALAFVLVFIGMKIFLVGFHIKIPSPLSLAVTFGLLVAGVLWSLWKTRGDAPPTAH